MAAREWDNYLESAAKRRAKITALHRKGMTPSKLAAKFGVTLPRIYQIIKRSRRDGR